jgi:hypothetical protein
MCKHAGSQRGCTVVGNMSHTKQIIRKQKLHARCEALITLTMMITAAFDVIPCIPVYCYQHSGGKIQAPDSSEMLVMMYWTMLSHPRRHTKKRTSLYSSVSIVTRLWAG